MEKAYCRLLRIIGVLLIGAAIMKGRQLLTIPTVNRDIWSSRVFLILVAELELGLGIWFVFGIFRKLSWLIALLCFIVFAVLTFYKALSGAASCGCFGSVDVNPWITLFAVVLPVILGLLIFRPGRIFEDGILSFASIVKLLKSSTSRLYLNSVILLTFLCVTVTSSVLFLNKPEKVTSEYMVLEPQNWIGKALPVIDYIDIGQQLIAGKWLILFYHHDCPDCVKAIKQFTAMDNEDQPVGLAVIEVPPYGGGVEGNLIRGKLSDVKEWFVTTPIILLIEDNTVTELWDGFADFHSEQTSVRGIYMKGGDTHGLVRGFAEGRNISR